MNRRRTTFVISSLILSLIFLAWVGLNQLLGMLGSSYINHTNPIPRNLTVDGKGNIYIFTSNMGMGRQEIEKLDGKGQYLARWGYFGTANEQLGDLIYPIVGIPNLVVDAQGTVFVVDQGNSRIQKFTTDGIFLTKWGSKGSNNGQFNNPTSITIDTQSNVYVTDTDNSRIQKFDANGNFLIKWGSKGSNDGEFDNPISIALDKENNVYVVDNGNFRIEKFDANGNFLIKWGFSTDTQTIGNSQIQPSIIAIDDRENIYVTDKALTQILKFDTKGQFENALNKPLAPHDGIYDDSYSGYESMTVDKQGNIYIAKGYYISIAGGGISDFDGFDQKYYNPHVQKFDNNGQFLARFQPNIPPYKGYPWWAWLIAPLLGIAIGGIVTLIRRPKRQN